MDVHASDFPCVYILIIGRVGEFRKKYNIPECYPDADLVLKYGKAKNFKTRLPQHSYKKNYGHDIQVLYTQYIDVIHIGAAEAALKDYFYGRILDVPTDIIVDEENDKEFISEGKKELFVMSDTKADYLHLQKIIDKISKNYAGRTKEFTHQLELKDKDIEHLKQMNEVLKSFIPNRQN